MRCRDHCVAGDSDVTDHSQTLEALFVLDGIAKQYARRAGDSYEQGLGRIAKTESLRRGALYRLKSYVLALFYLDGDIEEVHCHHVADEEYYRHHVGEYRFHTPVSKFEAYLHIHYGRREPDVELPPEPRWMPKITRLAAAAGAPALPDTPASPGESKRPAITAESTPYRHLDDFTTTETNRDELMDEREALQYLATEYESANTFLYPFTDGRPIGWSFLPGYVEEGDDIPESELQDSHSADFLFVVGDAIETIECGRVEITDRYGRWLGERVYRHPIIPRPVYDIYLPETDERRTGVRTERIMDDWRIHVDDPGNPLPDVDGPLADQVDSYDLDFEPGDVLVIDRGFEDGPVEWEVDHFCVHCSRLEVSLGPPDEDWTEPLSPEEFVDDIVEIVRM